MTDDIPELEPLDEPIAAPVTQIDYKGAIYQRMLAGAPAPFFNPGASKDYYRFFFAGVLITIGCLMPFDSDWSHVGYKFFSGGCWLVIGLGLIWSMWGAIHTGTVRMRWVLFAFFPFLWGLAHMIWATFPAEGVTNWGEVFSIIGATDDPQRFHKIGMALQHVGPGKIFVFFGGLMAVYGFFAGIFGGVQKIKQQKAERTAAAASRRGR